MGGLLDAGGGGGGYEEEETTTTTSSDDSDEEETYTFDTSTDTLSTRSGVTDAINDEDTEVVVEESDPSASSPAGGAGEEAATERQIADNQPDNSGVQSPDTLEDEQTPTEGMSTAVKGAAALLVGAVLVRR